jgi:hypothetical protein
MKPQVQNPSLPHKKTKHLRDREKAKTEIQTQIPGIERSSRVI